MFRPGVASKISLNGNLCRMANIFSHCFSPTLSLSTGLSGYQYGTDRHWQIHNGTFRGVFHDAPNDGNDKSGYLRDVVATVNKS